MNEINDEPSATDWKSRYQEAVHEWEAREAEWRGEIAALRRALVRVSTAAGPGGDKGKLESLREAVRQEAPVSQVESHARAVADSLLRQQQHTPATPVEATSPVTELLETLERRAPNRALRSEARQLLKGVEQDRAGASAEELWQAALALTARAARSGRPGALRSLFGRRNGEPQAEPGTDVTVPDTVRTPLSRLIEKLVRTEEDDPAARRLKRRLSREFPMDELPATVESVTELVVDASQEEMAALQAFLQQLTGRLFDIHLFLDDSETDTAGEREDSTALDEAIRSELADLENSVARASDLPGLQRAVQRQLESIVQHMDSFHRSQQRRQQAAEARIADLSNKLETTEQQADQLRRRLLQQQARAEVDTLTQLANRQAYEQRLEYEYARWRRYRSPLSLAMIDLDRFKAINDRFGHSAGDKVLRTAARVLRAQVRETDFLARYGGEEFALVMPETPLSRGVHTAEKLRAALEAAPFHAGEQRLPVTLSVGVAEFRDGDTRESAFERADRALYEAKERGRNQVAADRDTEPD